MGLLIEILKMIAVLGAAALLGNWFLSELKRSRASGQPWYRPYLSVPGLLIIVIVILLPVLLWMVNK